MNLVGIVEDTENGHQKYQEKLRGLAGSDIVCPIISVARSSLKNPEDFLVGQAIVFSAESVLREQKQILVGKRALVIGYGKIGSSIAATLASKGVRVDIAEADPVRQVLAFSHGYSVGRKEHFIRDADVIFCATGNKSIGLRDARNLKNNSFIFSATSADDELDDHVEFLKVGSYCPIQKISTMYLEGVRFFICNNGNAVNFLHGGVVGPFIRLVQAELVVAAGDLQKMDRGNISQLPDDTRRAIAEHWMKCYAQAMQS